MKFLKLFEDFDQGNMVEAGSASKTYIYYISNNSDSKFEADVRDPDGKIVYELTASDITNDSHMKDKNDISGLVKLLISKNKIKANDTVVPAADARAAQADEDFAGAVNTNMNI